MDEMNHDEENAKEVLVTLVSLARHMRFLIEICKNQNMSSISNIRK